MLCIVEAMTRLGFYTDEDDLILVVDPLISLLDGSLDIIDLDQLNRMTASLTNSVEENPQQDKPQQNLSKSFLMANKEDSEEDLLRARRYKINETNLLLNDTKIQILNILQRILDI